MNRSKKNIITLLILITALIAGIIIVFQMRKGPGSDTDVDQPSEGAEKKDGGSASIRSKETQKRTYSENDLGVSISGAIKFAGGIQDAPDFEKAIVELRTLSKPPMVVQSSSCSIPGEFSFPGVKEGEYLVDAVSKNDYYTLPKYIRIKGEKDVSDLTLTFQSKLNVKGIVLNNLSQPIEGAEVFIAEDTTWTYSPILFQEAVRRDLGKIMISDNEGRFSGYSRNDHLHIFVRKEGYEIIAACCGSIAEENKELVFKLFDGASIAGEVVDEYQQPVSDALVMADWESGTGSFRSNRDCPRLYIFETDEYGTLNLDGLRDGKFNVFIMNKDKTECALISCEVVAGETTNAGTIVIKPLYEIYGVVIDEEGKGIEGVNISAEFDDYETQSINQEPKTLFPLDNDDEDENVLTDNSGRFIIKCISDKGLTLKAEHEDYIPQSTPISSKDEVEDLEIVMTKTGFIHIKAKVIDSMSGEPVKGAKVIFEKKKDPYESTVIVNETEDETIKVTNTEGIADFRVHEPGQWSIIAASSTKVSNEKHMRLKEDFDQEIELLLEPSPSVVVTVQSKETGEPISGARINIKSKEYLRRSSVSEKIMDEMTGNPRTKENGTAEISMVPIGSYLIDVSAVGYAYIQEAFKINKGQNSLVIEMEKAFVVEGRIIDSDRKPIAGAEAFVRPVKSKKNYYMHYEPTRSDSDGAFQLEINIEGTRTFEIHAYHDLYATGKSELFETANKQSISDVEIVLTTGGSISGQVVDLDGEPIENVEVKCNPEAEEELKDEDIAYGYGPPYREDEKSTLTDKDGAYKIASLAPGNYKLNTSSKKYTDSELENILVHEGLETPDVDFTLNKGLQIKGLVVDKNNIPIEDAEISLFCPQKPEKGVVRSWSANRDTRTETKSDGVFLYEGLSKGEYNIYCSKKGYVGRGQNVNAGDVDIRIVLKEGGKLKGKVVKETDGLPITDFRVQILEDGDRHISYFQDRFTHKFTNREGGSFEISGLYPVKRDIEISAEDYAKKMIDDIEMKAERTIDIGTVKLSKGVDLNVTAVSEIEGVPIENAIVLVEEIESDNESDVGFIMYDSASSFGGTPGIKQGITNASGTCTVSNLNPGHMIIKVTHDNYVPSTLKVEVGKDVVEKYITFKLSEGVVLRGVVALKTTNIPVDGAEIQLGQGRRFGTDGKIGKTATNGIFEIGNIKPGKYEIMIIHEKYPRLREEITISKGMDTKEFYLSAGGDLLVRVKDNEANPISECGLTLSSKDFSIYEWKSTDKDGEALFEKLPPKRVSVGTNMSNDIRSAKAEAVDIVDIIEGETVELEFILGGGYTVYGKVTINNEPIEYIRIMVAPPQISEEAEGNVGQTMTDRNGQFRMEGLDSGKYMVIASSFSGQSKTEEITITDHDVEVNFVFSSGTISGNITDEDGNSIERAKVDIIPIKDSETDGAPGMSMMEMMMSFGGTRTGSEGEYTFSSVGKGKFRINAEKEGYSSDYKIVTKGEEDNLENVDLLLKSSCKISGRITTEDNGLISEATIGALDISGRMIKSSQVVLDSEGNYSFAGLAKGQYEILAAARGYAPGRKKVSITSEKQEDVDFKLSKGNSLTITVTDSSGEAVSGVTLNFIDKDPMVSTYLNRFYLYGTRSFFSSVTTDSEGLVSIDNLEKRKYIINISKSGYRSKKLTTQITGQDKTANVVLQKE